jgi:hypothetical protein
MAVPESLFDAEARLLAEEESRLAAAVRDTEERYSGLRDLDAVLSLAGARLRRALHLLRRSPPREEERALIAKLGRAALAPVESLVTENLSEDQRGEIQARRLFAEVRSLAEEFVLAGGSSLLQDDPDARRRRTLARSVTASIRKYFGEDDLYPPLALDKLPGWLRSVVLFLFPVMFREHPEQPPYGIAEGEEVTYSSQALQLPLSQAVFYLENELLPMLEEELAKAPGTASLQNEIARVTARVEEYRKLRFIPRSTPVLLEQGFHTEGMTSYTADGEMLVAIPIPVSFRSGTNLDRKMELVRMDLVRRLAGRGVSPEVDEEYARLRSLESGPRGSSRAPSMKLDAAWGYGVLRREYPFLRRLADKEAFKALVTAVGAGGRGPGERLIESMIDEDGRSSDLRSPSLPL